MTEHLDRKPQDNKSKLPLTELEVRNHINRNLLSTNPTLNSGALKKRRCGDGRDEQESVEAVFGADLGYFYPALVTMRELVGTDVTNTLERATTVLETVSSVLGDEIDVHTDHHAPPGFIAAGCGYNKQAKALHKFGLTDTELRATEVFLQKKQIQGNLDQETYHTDHTEGAVVLVDSEDFGIRSFDKELSSSVFVVHRTLVKKRLQQLAEVLAARYQLPAAQVLERLTANFDSQVEITRQALAAGLPVYEAKIAKDKTIDLHQII